MARNAQYFPFNTKRTRGILRTAQKNPVRSRFHIVEETKEEDLFVFGYACKLFPPDANSQFIAKQQHLIPWNGDENLQLLIDRYDARASLHDLSEFEIDSWNKHYETSEEEIRIEQLCDVERYMALHTDIAEEKIRHEEELKRLHASIASSEDRSALNEVGFDYNTVPKEQEYDPFNPTKENDESVQETETREETEVCEEKPFMAPSSLLVPSDMEIPPTEKMHAIIEKTAVFVASQGTQMEIVLKAKQANNSQFLFLQFDHYLNPYYKHMIKRIKEGKYTPGIPDEDVTKENEDSDSSDGMDGGYLHPSLFASSSAQKKEEEIRNTEKFKAIQKVDPNHPLAKLIEKGKRANALKQYNMMKTAVQNFNPSSDSVEPPPLPPFASVDSVSSIRSYGQSTTITHEPAGRIVPPPPDIQPMVDSIARQIAEEGDSVGEIMCARNDPMLAFLLPSHELHPYYMFRKNFIRQELQTRQKLEVNEKNSVQSLDENDHPEEDQLKPGKATTISFSIKPKKESTSNQSLLSLPNRLQLLGEEESDGNDDKEEKEAITDKTDVIEDNHEIENNNIEELPSEKQVLVLPTEESVITPSMATTSVVSSSNFTVVTPSGAPASIAEVREKQAVRRQKLTLFLMMKSKTVSEDEKTEVTSQKPPAVSEDIFNIDDDDEDELSPNHKLNCEAPSTEPNDILTIQKHQKTVISSMSTLKDLIESAPLSTSEPSSPCSKRNRRHSRSRSPSRHSTPTTFSSRRSGSNTLVTNITLPSSYRKILGSSRETEVRFSDKKGTISKEDDSTPSAYRVENCSLAERRGKFESPRSSRDESESNLRHHSHKRKRHDSERSSGRHHHHKQSHKSKKKHRHSVKANKKHKKGEKKKSKKKKESASEEGEWSSSSDDEQNNGKL